jgi:hypothetical protein
MPFGGNQIQEGRKVKPAFLIHGTEGRHPPEALGQVQKDRTDGHPWGSIAIQQGLPGPGQQLVLPVSTLVGRHPAAAVPQARHPERIRTGSKVCGSDQD